MGNKGYCEQILGRESADITKQCIKVLDFSLFKMFNFYFYFLNSTYYQRRIPL